MAFERKTLDNNNKYPTTQYGASVVGELLNKGASVAGSGTEHIYTLEYEVDLAEGFPDGDTADPSVVVIPKGAILKEAYIKVLEKVTGGTDGITLGLNKLDGTTLSADGIEKENAALTDVGDSALATGALIGGAALTEGARMAENGDRTAGRLLIRLRYFGPNK